MPLPSLPRHLLIAPLLVALLALAGCRSAPVPDSTPTAPGSLRRFEFTRLCMGVQTRILLFAPDAQTASTNAAAAFDQIARLDSIMSDYRPDSELMRLCAAGADGAGRPIPVSDDLFEILQAAQTLSAQTDGAFDITVGPVVQLWRTAPRTHILPSESELAAARASVGYQSLQLDAAKRTARLLKPNMRLDLGSIAKGFAAQRAVDTLAQLHTPCCLVGLAGDIAAGDAPPNSRGWTISIEHDPTAERSTLLLANAAVSTSGPSQQFVEIGGRRYSHIVDPRTGRGLTDRTYATVVAPRDREADSLSTALCILGPSHAAALLAEYPGAGAIIDQTSPPGGTIRSIIDPSFVIHLRPSPSHPPAP